MRNLFGLNDPDHDWRDSIAALTGAAAWGLVFFVVVPLLWRGGHGHPHDREFALVVLLAALGVAVSGALLGRAERFAGTAGRRRWLLPVSATVLILVLTALCIDLLHFTKLRQFAFILWLTVTPAGGVLLAWRATRRPVSSVAALAGLWLWPFVVLHIMALSWTSLADMIKAWRWAVSALTGPWARYVAHKLGLHDEMRFMPWASIVVLVVLAGMLLSRRKARPWAILVWGVFMQWWAAMATLHD